MTGSPLWPLRDDRTLSEHAKLAYLMLWLRGSDVHPSMRRLAGDMSVAQSTATKAIRELQDAGLVKVLPRVTPKGDPDTNQFVLTPPREAGYPRSRDGGGVPRETDPKDRSRSKESKGVNTLAAWRARPAPLRDDDSKIGVVRTAVDHRGWDNSDLEDEDALDIYARFITDRVTDSPVADEVAYLYSRKSRRGIFDSFEHLDGVLSNTSPREEEWTA